MTDSQEATLRSLVTEAQEQGNEALYKALSLVLGCEFAGATEALVVWCLPFVEGVLQELYREEARRARKN